MHCFSPRALPTCTKVFETYFRFAAERQAIYFRKIRNLPAPWTKDPILQNYRFTNAYRAADRTSQYLIKKVIYTGDTDAEEVFFRICLFRLFNKIETWKRLLSELQEIQYKTYDFRRYNDILTTLLERKERIYSAAYIMPSAIIYGYERKHSNHLKLLEQMMSERVALRLAKLKTFQQAFELLRTYPSLGNFLAYQLAIDINYSNLLNFSEMDFVIPGPGALDGIKKCFSSTGGRTEQEIIHYTAEIQEQEFERLGIQFPSLWGRKLQLIDCQNLFCEISKYARIAHPDVQGLSGRMRIKQKYRPLHEKNTAAPWFPPKWNLDSKYRNESLTPEDQIDAFLEH